MLKHKEYELYLAESGELLVDKLSFREVPALFQAYEDLYGKDSIAVCCREFKRDIKLEIHSMASDYKQAWIDYFGELQTLGNIL